MAAKAKETEAVKTEQTTGEKMVQIRLYMGDRAETKRPVKVIINGQQFIVPRGKTVEVPDYVAACIEDSEAAKLEEEEFNEAARDVRLADI